MSDTDWTRLMREALAITQAQHGGDREKGLRTLSKWISNARPNSRRGRVRRNDLRREHKQQIMERDGYRCRSCGSCHRLTIHHDRAIRDGGTHDGDNLLTLCRDCHDLIEARRDLLLVLRERCAALVALEPRRRQRDLPVSQRRAYRFRLERALRADAATPPLRGG